MTKKNEKKNYLDMIPVANEEYGFEIHEDGIGVITIENKGVYNKIAQKLFKKPKRSLISLDEYGTFVFRNIDGVRTIYEISELVKTQFGADAEPLLERLVTYFRILKNNRFISYRK